MHPMKARFTLMVLPLLTLPAIVHAQFTYTTNNGTITITGYTGPGGDVTIPDFTDGRLVTRIGDSAFRDRISLTSVTIPGSVTNMGSYVFLGCAGLTNVTIPNSLTNIGWQAFD